MEDCTSFVCMAVENSNPARCGRCYADDICYISITVNIIHSQMENLFKRAFVDFPSILPTFFCCTTAFRCKPCFSHLRGIYFRFLSKKKLFLSTKRKKNIVNIKNWKWFFTIDRWTPQFSFFTKGGVENFFHFGGDSLRWFKFEFEISLY